MNGSSQRTRRLARPAHPPFTDFPLAAYVFAAGFDLISAIGGSQRGWAADLWRSGTFILIGGLCICLITMGTGFWDLTRYPPPVPGTVRIVAAHVCAMAAAFMLGAADVACRVSNYHAAAAPPAVVALSLAAAIVACTGGFLGGSLVFRYGIGVAAGRGAGTKPAADAPEPEPEPEPTSPQPPWLRPFD
jgi:uncharacterized membrane protein